MRTRVAIVLLGECAAACLSAGCSDSASSAKSICEPQQAFCLGNTRVQCSADGTSIIWLDQCGLNMVCTPAGCSGLLDGLNGNDEEGQTDGVTSHEISDGLTDGQSVGIDSYDANNDVTMPGDRGPDEQGTTDTNLPALEFDEPVVVQKVSSDGVGSPLPPGTPLANRALFPFDVVFNDDKTMYVLYTGLHGPESAGGWVVQRTLDGKLVDQWFATSCVHSPVSSNGCYVMTKVENPPMLVLAGLGVKGNKLHFYSTNGLPITSVGQYVTTKSPALDEVGSVDGLCVHQPSKRIYVVDGWASRVVVYLVDAEPLFQFGSAGTGKGYLSGGYDCMVVKDRLYVSDHGRITEFDLDGNYVNTFGSPLSWNGLMSAPSLSPFFADYFLAWSRHYTAKGNGDYVRGFHLFTYEGKLAYFGSTDFLGGEYTRAQMGPNNLLYVMNRLDYNPTFDSNYLVLDFGLNSNTQTK